MVIICGLSVFPTMQTLIAQEVSRKLMRRLQEDPRPPWNDPEWMGGRDARAIRIMTEFLAPQSILFDRGIRDTVVFFGSARTDLKHADAEAAREIAKRLSTWATTSPKEGGGAREDGSQRFHVCTGGGPGIMAASNFGAADAEADNIGLGIELPFEPSLNEWITEGLGIQFKYFAMRKFWFIYPAKAILVFPGGFGTLDELFEVLTLIQTGKISKQLPIILWNEEYWRRMVDWEMLRDEGMIGAEDLELLKFSSDIDEVENWLIDHLQNLPEIEPRAP